MTDLTRLTVNLTPKATRALQHVSELREETKTESVNRALHLYEMWVKAEADGDEFYIKGPKGKVRFVTLL